jgi:Alkaline phytoceramidase (aPHC).
MWLGIKGLRNVLAYNHSWVFTPVYLGYLTVGLGSMAFHTTLKCLHPCILSGSYRFNLFFCSYFLISTLWSQLSYTSRVVTDEMQLADELPMIYTVCIMGFAAFSYRRSVKEQLLVAACMTSIAVFITVRYKSPFF